MTTLPTLWRTVLRAVEILRDEGLVFTVPRRGTYVSPDNRCGRSLLLWGPPGDHTVSMRPNNPQVATRQPRSILTGHRR